MRRRLPVGLVVLLAAAMLVGCSPVLETHQARLCRMALPALMPEGARIAIQAQTPDRGPAGPHVAFTAEASGEARSIISRPAAFASPDGRANRAIPRRSRSTASLSRKPGSTFWSAIGWRRRRAAPRIPRLSAT